MGVDGKAVKKTLRELETQVLGSPRLGSLEPSQLLCEEGHLIVDGGAV